MEDLRNEMEEEFIKNGLSPRAIYLSQKLDVLVTKEQERRLRAI